MRLWPIWDGANLGFSPPVSAAITTWSPPQSFFRGATGRSRASCIASGCSSARCMVALISPSPAAHPPRSPRPIRIDGYDRRTNHQERRRTRIMRALTECNAHHGERSGLWENSASIPVRDCRVVADAVIEERGGRLSGAAWQCERNEFGRESEPCKQATATQAHEGGMRGCSAQSRRRSPTVRTSPR